MYTENKMSKVLLCLGALMVLVGVSAAQAPDSQAEARARAEAFEACINELEECGPFARSTTTRPPTTCCQPLENVIQNNFACLCMMFSEDEVIQALEINVTNAITLPQRCGLQPFDLSSDCQGPLAPSTIAAFSPTNVPVSIAPSDAPSEAPPETPTANAPASGRDDSGANNIAWAGSPIMGSFLFCAALMFY